MSDLICQIFPFQPSTSMYYISLSLVFGNMMINAKIQMTIQRSSVGQLTIFHSATIRSKYFA